MSAKMVIAPTSILKDATALALDVVSEALQWPQVRLASRHALAVLCVALAVGVVVVLAKLGVVVVLAKLGGGPGAYSGAGDADTSVSSGIPEPLTAEEKSLVHELATADAGGAEPLALTVGQFEALLREAKDRYPGATTAAVCAAAQELSRSSVYGRPDLTVLGSLTVLVRGPMPVGVSFGAEPHVTASLVSSRIFQDYQAAQARQQQLVAEQQAALQETIQENVGRAREETRWRRLSPELQARWEKGLKSIIDPDERAEAEGTLREWLRNPEAYEREYGGPPSPPYVSSYGAY